MTPKKKWFEQDISVETATEFFDQMYSFTQEFIVNFAPEVKDCWPPTTILPQHYFDPKGIVIHTSGTTSIWNTLLNQTRNIYGSHVIICSKDHQFSANIPQEYKLLRSLRSLALAPFKITQGILHSGYLSQDTFGIELRSAGRLRPFDMDTQPTPILPIEENHAVFHEDYNKSLRFYQPINAWRSKFNGPVYEWHGYYYEQPTMQQFFTLVVVARAMYALIKDNIDLRLVIPGNCITNIFPELPIIPWDLFRNMMVGKNVLTHKNQGSNERGDVLKTLFRTQRSCAYELEDIDDETDATLMERINERRWRGQMDNGERTMLFDVDLNRKYSFVNKRRFQEIGYHVDTRLDAHFAMQMLAISQNIGDRDEDEVFKKFVEIMPCSDNNWIPVSNR